MLFTIAPSSDLSAVNRDGMTVPPRRSGREAELLERAALEALRCAYDEVHTSRLVAIPQNRTLRPLS